jgi:hypothetical protein
MFALEPERGQQRIHVNLLALKQEQPRMQDSIFEHEPGRAQQVHRVNIRRGKPGFDRQVTLDERVDDKSPEFLFAEGQIGVVYRVLGFDFLKHFDKRFRAHMLHMSVSLLKVRDSVVTIRSLPQSD